MSEEDEWAGDQWDLDVQILNFKEASEYLENEPSLKFQKTF
jgi:hypothetical protein